MSRPDHWPVYARACALCDSMGMVWSDERDEMVECEDCCGTGYTLPTNDETPFTCLKCGATLEWDAEADAVEECDCDVGDMPAEEEEPTL